MFKLGGIPLGADLGWLFALIILAFVAAVGIFPVVRDVFLSILLGLVLTFLFFVSILIHELAHAYTAKLSGLAVLSITLHPFGGSARFASEPSTPRSEFLIAAAGPLASLVLAAVFGLLAFAFNAAEYKTLSVASAVLSLVNFLTALFNLLPGYPLDGGRMLRSYLWKRGKPTDEATLTTAFFGQVISFAIAVIGLLLILFRGEFFSGLWAILAAAFLFSSAHSVIELIRSENHLTVSNYIRLVPSLSPDTTIQKVVDEVLPFYRTTVYPVMENGRFYGALDLGKLRLVSPGLWRQITIREAIERFGSAERLEYDTTIKSARKILGDREAAIVFDKSGMVAGVFDLTYLPPKPK